MRITAFKQYLENFTGGKAEIENLPDYHSQPELLKGAYYSRYRDRLKSPKWLSNKPTIQEVSIKFIFTDILEGKTYGYNLTLLDIANRKVKITPNPNFMIDSYVTASQDLTDYLVGEYDAFLIELGFK